MVVNVYIPTPFRRLTGNRTNVEAQGGTVAEVIAELDARFPGLRAQITDERDEVPAHITIYVNNREISALQGTRTPLADGDELAVIPAIAGGADEAGASSGNGASPENGAAAPAPGPRVLTPDQVTRYSRHIIMPQVGP